jgi:hypothetical protein
MNPVGSRISPGPGVVPGLLLDPLERPLVPALGEDAALPVGQVRRRYCPQVPVFDGRALRGRLAARPEEGGQPQVQREGGDDQCDERCDQYRGMVRAYHSSSPAYTALPSRSSRRVNTTAPRPRRTTPMPRRRRAAVRPPPERARPCPLGDETDQ